MSILIQIAQNILLLSFIGIAYFLIESRRKSLGDFKTNVLNGFCFGLTAALVTAMPVTLGDGATIDARAGPVILAGVVAGPTGGLIAAIIGGVARGIVGGSFALSGMAVYLVYAILGTALGYYRIVSTPTLFHWRSIGIVVAASLAGASAMFFLITPTSRAIQWLQNDLPYILVANSLSVTFAALVLGIAIVYLRKSGELIRVSETLDLARRTGRFGIWDYDINTGKVLWDERSQQMHGVILADSIGSMEHWEKAVHPEDLDKARDSFYQAMAGNENYDAEYRVIHPDGSQRSIKGDATIVRDRAGNPVRVVGTNIDVTELREADLKLAEARALAFQAQRAETVGQLTGGVAHDFNNLLAVIMGSLELLQGELNNERVDRRESQKLIDASLEASTRGVQLTQNMLAYARKAQLNPELVDINEVVRETRNWLRRTIERNVELRTRLHSGLWLTRADKTSLQSALVNLLVNARDAIEGSGVVTIETKNIEIDGPAGDTSDDPLSPGRYVQLVVADTGVGMEQDMLDRIFDPFFTTKPVDKGTGLGLSMVQGFVKQSQGTINVESKSGEGTTFTLMFPAEARATEESATGVQKRGSSDQQANAEGRILLVEDQPAVMNVLQMMIGSAGYDVVTAGSGDEALEMYKHDDQFDLVVTDIVMPGKLQGPMLAKEIRRHRPDMRFMFLSGYASGENGMGDGISPEDIRLIKPIARAELLRAIETRLSTD